MTGQRYIQSLRDGREVWLDGKRVDDVTTHAAFRDMVHALAHLYDKQNDTHRDDMTYVDPESGVRTSLSWLVPQTREDSEYKSRLFRFAHDLSMSSFGMRQDIYEYWHAGDPSRNRINLLRAYDQSDIKSMVQDMCSRPLPHGDVPS